MTGGLSAFINGLDEATQLGLAGAIAGAIFGLCASAFVLGALWALRGRPALRTPECRRCGSMLRVDDASGRPQLPDACPECGEVCDRVGAVRWFRYRRQAATLGVTFPIVLVGGLALSGIATAIAMKALFDATRPIIVSSTPITGRPTPVYDHRLDDPDSYLEVIARVDVVEIAWRLSDLDGEIESLGNADSLVPGLRRLRETLLRGDAGEGLEATRERALALRYATLDAIEARLSDADASLVEEFTEGRSRLLDTFRLTGPRRVAVGGPILLRLAPPIPDAVLPSGGYAPVVRVDVDGQPVPWQPETWGARTGLLSLQAPAELGEHELSVAFGGDVFGEVRRRTLRFEVVEGTPTLEPIVDEAFDVVTGILTPNSNARSGETITVELEAVGRRRLLMVSHRHCDSSPILHGELVVALGDERIVLAAGPRLGSARLGAVGDGVLAPPRLLRIAYRPAPLEERPPHPRGLGTRFAAADAATHPGWWGRAFGLELMALPSDHQGRTEYAPTRALTPEEIAEILNPAEPTRPDGPDPSS